MKHIVHTITPTEINYGIITLTKKDGVKQFFDELPPRYDIQIGMTTFTHRKTLLNKIWLGRRSLQNFCVGDIVMISKNSGIINIEKYYKTNSSSKNLELQFC